MNSNEFGHSNFFDSGTSDTIQFVLVGVLLTFVGVLGVFGNIFSIIVLCQKKIHASLTILLIGLSVSDLFVCILLIVLKGLPALFKYKSFWLSYNLWMCGPKRFIFPCLQTVQLFSTYFTVAITIERFIAVSLPLKSRSICTSKKSKQLTVGIVIFSILSNVLMFYTHIQREEFVNDKTLSCQSIPAANIPEFINHMRLGIYAVVNYLIPLVIVVVANVFIVKKIHINNRARENFNQNELKEIKLTNMLIVVVAVYVVCNIFRVINSVTNNILHVTYAEFVALTELLVIVNSAVNYLIYCAYGKNFRQSFVQMFCKCLPRATAEDGNATRRQSDESNRTEVMTEMSIVRSIRKLSKGMMTFGQTIGRSRKCDVEV